MYDPVVVGKMGWFMAVKIWFCSCQQPIFNLVGIMMGPNLPKNRLPILRANLEDGVQCVWKLLIVQKQWCFNDAPLMQSAGNKEMRCSMIVCGPALICVLQLRARQGIHVQQDTARYQLADSHQVCCIQSGRCTELTDYGFHRVFTKGRRATSVLPGPMIWNQSPPPHPFIPSRFAHQNMVGIPHCTSPKPVCYVWISGNCTSLMAVIVVCFNST